MSLTFKRVCSILLGVLLITYLCYHAFVVPYQSVETEQAVSYAARDAIEAQNAYIIRTETTVDGKVSGSYRYEIGNGERVSAGGVIANIYQNDSTVQALSRIDDLDRQIANLEALTNYSSGVVVDIDQLNEQANEGLVDLLNTVEQGDFSHCKDKAQDFLSSIRWSR